MSSAMDFEPSETKQETPNASTSSEPVDVEMNLSVTVLTKPDPSNTDQNGAERTPKKKKKSKKSSPNSGKKPKKDPNKPEYPKVGYVRFMFVRREAIRVEFPDMHHLDVTKKIGEEWTVLSDEQKKPYLDAANEDKIRYQNEMKEYNKNLLKSGTTNKPIKRKKKSKKLDNSTDTDFEPTPKKSKRRGGGGETTEPLTATPKSTPSKKPTTTTSTPINELPALPRMSSINSPPPSPPQISLQTFGDIPIFTDQFLDHNRQMESELKRIRKMNIDIDQQNSVLDKYAESVQIGIAKATTEIDELTSDNEKLSTYLYELRTKLVGKLQHLSISSEPNGANIDNIDKFMEDLLVMAQTNEHGPASLNKAKDLLRKVDLNIYVKSAPKDMIESN